MQLIQPANVIELKPFSGSFMQFQGCSPACSTVLQSHCLSVSADIRLREGGHKLCSRQLTVNRPTAKAAKLDNGEERSNLALTGKHTKQHARDYLNLCTSPVSVWLCVRESVCVCVLCAVCSWQNKYKNCQSQRQKIKRECNEKRSKSKGNSNTRTCCASSLTNTHTHTVQVCVCVFCAQ